MDDSPEPSQSPEVSGKLYNVACRTVGYILSISEQNSSVISRGKLQKAVKTFATAENLPRCPLADLLVVVNEQLDSVFGYELVGISDTKVNTISTKLEIQTRPVKENAVKSKDINYFALLNKLKPMEVLETFKMQQATYEYMKHIVEPYETGDSDEGDGDDMAINNTINSQFETQENLMMKGILSVVLCIILFSRNNVLETDLYAQLKKFGISENGAVPNLDLILDDILKIFISQQYIEKVEQSAETGGVLVTYHIGRRTRYEFDFDSLLNLIKHIMDLDASKDERLTRDIKRALADSYK
ncbi:Non-structural maintenance of chromosome element 3 [Nakaseomyces bracarensis]|uniref:Non-structural maintenance of chromosome element 3 n=1 Tax=Nakaseomyces bracarensis TaxID=273131 RepID=A0ABR4NS77_9SACH